MKKNKSMIAREIMADIECGKLCMKKRELFLLEHLAVVFFVFTIFTGVGVGIAFIDYWVRMAGGYNDILWSEFPFYWLIISMFFIFLGSNLYNRIGENYKKVFLAKLAIVVGILIFICILAVVLERYAIKTTSMLGV